MFRSAIKTSLLSLCLLVTSSQGLRAETAAADPALVELYQSAQKAVDDTHVAGLVMAASRDGQPWVLRAVGAQDREAGIPMAADSIFRAYSMTKPVVAAAVLILVDDGKLSLDDPVSRWIPAFGNVKVGVEHKGFFGMGRGIDYVVLQRPMTVRHLLTHTSGLGYGWGKSPIDELYKKAGTGSKDWTLAQAVDKLASLPLKHQPGSYWEYGFSLDVAGRVVEVVSGKSLDDFLAERLFKPLGMKDSGFYVPQESQSRMAAIYKAGWVKRKAERMQEDAASFDYKRRPIFLSGGAGLVSTATDYLRFYEMLEKKGLWQGKRVLSEASVAAMLSNQVGKVDCDFLGRLVGVKKNGFGLGLGIFPTPRGGKRYGWAGLAGGEAWVDPGRGVASVLMVHIFHPFIANAYTELVYKALDKK